MNFKDFITSCNKSYQDDIIPIFQDKMLESIKTSRENSNNINQLLGDYTSKASAAALYLANELTLKHLESYDNCLNISNKFIFSSST